MLKLIDRAYVALGILVSMICLRMAVVLAKGMLGL